MNDSGRGVKYDVFFSLSPSERLAILSAITGSADDLTIYKIPPKQISRTTGSKNVQTIYVFTLSSSVHLPS